MIPLFKALIWLYNSYLNIVNIHRYTPITLYPTAPLYNIIIIFDTVLIGRNEFVNAKDNEFNSAAISLLWHPPAMLCGVQINVAGIQRR